MRPSGKTKTPGFLVLAAGESVRFGEPCKLLSKLPNGSSLIDNTLAALSAVNNKICVVLSETSPLKKRVAELPFDYTVYPGKSPGLGDSLAWGVRATEAWGGWIICLADMPWIDSKAYRAVFDLACKQNNIIAPTFNGQRGHPVFFPPKFREQLAALRGDSGANSIIKSHASELLTLESACEGVLMDVDVPVDLHSSIK
ncbi:molybdenum cofactor cytidylyltransferase [Alteromonadaceae bacterium Bs31]|nr:molybdenum cofactor cytidylyltransferase [Alteromonadaceae bacterium Bs31]